MPDFVVGIRITAKNDTAAIEAARQQFANLDKAQLTAMRNAQQAANAGAKDVGVLGKAWNSLKSTLLGYGAALLGIGAVLRTFRESIRQFSEAEQSLVSLRATIKTFDASSKVSAETVHQWASAVQQQTQVADDLVERLVARFLPATKSTTGAMYLSSLAAKAQKAGWLDASSAADTLGAAMMGRVRRGGDQLSQILYGGKVTGEAFAVTLGKINRALDDATSRASTATEELERMRLEEGDAMEAMGQATARLAIAFEGPRKAWTIFQALVIGGIQKIAAWVSYGITSIKGWGDVMLQVALGPMGDVGKAWEKHKANLVLSEQDIAKVNASVDQMLTDVWSAFDKSPAIAQSLKERMEREGMAAAVAAQQALMDAKNREDAAKAQSGALDSVAKAIESEIALHEASADAATDSAETKQRHYERLVELLGALQDAQLDVINAEERATVEAAEGNAAIITEAHRKAGQDRLTIINAISAKIIGAEKVITDAVRVEADRRAQAEIDAAERRVSAIEREIAILQVRAENVSLAPEQRLAAEAELLQLRLTVLERKAENIELEKKLALEKAVREGKSPAEQKDIAAGFDEKIEKFKADSEVLTEEANNAQEARLQSLIEMGMTQAEIEQQRVDRTKAAIRAEMALYEEGSKRYKQLKRAEIEVDRQAAMAKAQLALDVAGQVVGALQALFGESKALAIAATIIETLEASVRAIQIYGPTPLGYAAAASAVVFGFAKIATMKSTGPGSSGGGGQQNVLFNEHPESNAALNRPGGFDVPANDRLIYMMGRKWAEDQASLLSRGYRDAIPPAHDAARSSVSNVSNVENIGGANVRVNVRALSAREGREMGGEIARAIARAERRRSRSLLGRGARKLGGAA